MVRNHAMEALRESEERLRTIYEQAAVGISCIGLDGTFVEVNRMFCDMLGFARDEIEGMSYLAVTHPDDRDSSLHRVEATLAGARDSYAAEKRCLRKDGTVFWAKITVSLVREADGSPKHFIAVMEDISERKQAEEAARLAQFRLANAIETFNEGFALYDANDLLVMCNTAYRRMSGLVDFLKPGVTFEEYLRESLRRHLIPAAVGREPEWLAERLDMHRNPSGPFELSRTGINAEVRPHRLLDGGTMYIIVDITKRKAAEEELRQAQKMEAIGKLTGGVAHDFNNLLAIILGNLDLIHERFPLEGKLQSLVSPALAAAERGATLTERLLAFSRKQALQPRLVGLNDLLNDLTELLQRSLGETIQVETLTEPELWPCEVDPGQMESVLLNLAVNARDAMANGGRLTIETSNVRLDQADAELNPEVGAGDYVRLTVADNGCGMTEEVLDRAFEPFFTTKKVGQGTGLGLSMIYGFVKQSGGHVEIASEPGEGTAVDVYLPRVVPASQVSPRGKAKSPSPKARGESVLLVEDDPEVLNLGVTLLRELGYAVMQAQDGPSALNLLEDAEEFDLLLTDVVLPGGMNGKELADAVQRLRPSVRVLFMSGYSENAIGEEGKMTAGVHLLQKPFRKSLLARKVREALGDGGVPNVG